MVTAAGPMTDMTMADVPEAVRLPIEAAVVRQVQQFLHDLIARNEEKDSDNSPVPVVDALSTLDAGATRGRSERPAETLAGKEMVHG
jgi:hypothetical protein